MRVDVFVEGLVFVRVFVDESDDDNSSGVNEREILFETDEVLLFVFWAETSKQIITSIKNTKKKIKNKFRGSDDISSLFVDLHLSYFLLLNQMRRIV